MNDIRHFLIKLLAGERTVILNATISNGHIYLEKGKEFIVENNVVSHDDKYSEPEGTITIGDIFSLHR